MKIIVDENISFGEEAFSVLGDVTLNHGREITNKSLRNADALITRSITNVNEELLDGTNIKFVGTATIGTDHIDVQYLSEKGITFASAAGCNSHAVKEYVFTAILNLYKRENITFENKSIGVIGVGNIGSKVAKIAELLGMKVFRNDPPLQRESGGGEYCSIEEALQCDIVTLHTPLNLEGIDKTYHLLNEKNLSLIKPGAMLINSCRGPVVDNKALKYRLRKKNDILTVFDVWESEPDIDIELLELVDLRSAHIAGYTLEGKVNGTVLIYEALCSFFGKEPTWKPKLPNVENKFIELNKTQSKEKLFDRLFRKNYSINKDDDLLKTMISLEPGKRGKHFDGLRKNYRLRRELNNYFVKNEHVINEFRNIINELRIKIV